MRKYYVAAIQMDTQDNKEENMKNLLPLIDEAAHKGAKLIALPEYYNSLGEDNPEEPIPGPSTDPLIEKAKEHSIYINTGSITEINPGGGLPLNTSLMINPKGEIVARYSKVHLFDVNTNGIEVYESHSRAAGDAIVTVGTELGKMGLSICYDIRFPELYRIMALDGAQVMFAPANFMMNTGKDHWLPLLQSRAIENGCYMVAPCQCGKKKRNFALGKTVIIDPWGNVIAKSIEGPCVVLAEIDLDYLEDIRNQIPSLKNRMPNVYDIKAK